MIQRKTTKYLHICEKPIVRFFAFCWVQACNLSAGKWSSPNTWFTGDSQSAALLVVTWIHRNSTDACWSHQVHQQQGPPVNPVHQRTEVHLVVNRQYVLVWAYSGNIPAVALHKRDRCWSKSKRNLNRGNSIYDPLESAKKNTWIWSGQHEWKLAKFPFPAR